MALPGIAGGLQGACAGARAQENMRVLHVIPSLAERDGGPSKAAVEMCRALGERGIEAEIYTTNLDGRKVLDIPLGCPVQVRGVSVTYFRVDRARPYKVSRGLAMALRRSIPRYDLVHIHSLYQFPSAAAAYYSRKFHVPYFMRPHGTLDPYLFNHHWIRKRIYELIVERRNLRAAAAVHFTSEDEERLARGLGLKFRSAVIPLGVYPHPSASFESAPAVTQLWPETAGRIVVLFLGRINFKKGLDILAKAFSAVTRRRRDLHLLIVGPDDDGLSARVKRRLRQGGALEHVTFTGLLSDQRKWSVLRDSHMFVLPSYSENFGIAVVEAMEAGLPVIVSDRVNIWREVAAEGAGLVVGLRSEEVGSAIETLADSPGARLTMGANGKRLARTRFSWPRATERLQALYLETLESAGRLRC